jgi:hypothetical protein
MAAAPIAVFARWPRSSRRRARHPVDLRQVHGEFYFGIDPVGAARRRGFLFLGPACPAHRLIREPILLAFSTASSEAAYPKTLEQLERFGASKKITSFVLPLGYSFNLDGR